MAKSSFKLNILYGEGDTEVVTAQAAAMEKAGHQVTPAIGRKEVEAALKKGSFDLVILGPTLSRNDRHHLPYMAKKANSSSRVLVIHASGKHPEVDAAIDSRDGDHVLLEALAGLLEPAFA